ncbi:MAG: hypothetical protein HY854_05075 [Burkholderiales bacterium]|nr:hypothetical protein [Burkholderiales bacterium]
MKSEVTVTFKDCAPVRIPLDGVQPMTAQEARAWLDDQFAKLGCEPFRPTGKVLVADKVFVVAQAAGPALFADAAWAGEFARAASAALDRPVVNVDVPAQSVGY